MQRYKRFRHMQERIQKISPIKQRILQFVDTLGITKRDFYAKTGISRGTLESATGITEDTITKVFAIYPSLSPSWLIMGAGEMLIKQEDDERNCNLNCNPNCNLSDENMYLSSQPDNIYPSHRIAAEPSTDDMYKKDSPVQQCNGMNDIIMNLVEQIKEQSEEIGALRQENSALKHRLAQIAEDVGNAQSARA